MRILTVHAKYAFRGGEDEVREAERDLLRAHGHQVGEYVQNNETIQGDRPWKTGLRTIWSQADYRRIRERIRADKSEIVAVHNFFPLISPAVYYAARAEGIPVVQTLHNFRLICPSATLLRNDRTCEDCVGRAVPLPGVVHACYRGSRILSAGVAAMTSAHRAVGTWQRMVDRYIVLSDFMRNKFVSGGLPTEKISVKPNFTVDSGAGKGLGGYFLFVGRLSREKGVATLLRAWQLACPPGELRILGSGPEELNLRSQAASLPNVRFLGQQTRQRVQEEMGDVTVLIVPSLWPEAFGLTIIESFAKGTPVIGSNIGAIPSLVAEGESGLLFRPGDEQELAGLLRSSRFQSSMRAGARRAYEARFTPQCNYTALLEIYSSLLGVC